ncbi:hypothetical protein E3N88_12993 [Mikania micrantha]|uniref:Uncharacterized protein n=1 Tax=Mikania micrantha TaxID=192012 RepID=A0A5N6P925_9ASTR|nr:hypothetical protein E3N88_12993 [Mikania micrantha]
MLVIRSPSEPPLPPSSPSPTPPPFRSHLKLTGALAKEDQEKKPHARHQREEVHDRIRRIEISKGWKQGNLLIVLLFDQGRAYCRDQEAKKSLTPTDWIRLWEHLWPINVVPEES